MKSVILLLLPVLVIAAPEKRYFLNDLTKLINLDTIKQDLQLLINITGSDPTEQACEEAAHKYLTGLLDHAVPLLCHSFQELVHHFNIVPGKRYLPSPLTNLIDTDTIKKDLQLMIDLTGSDPTEQACEQAGHQYLTGLLDHAVPLICHSFQELIQHFHIVPTTGKRYVLDTLTKLINLDTIKKDLQLLIDLVGSDPTEQACEQAGHQYLAGLLDHAVPLLCHSFQELVHHFHIVPATTTVAPGKRYLLGTLTNLIDIDTLKKHLQQLVNLIGSDPTEQACEQAARQYLTGLLAHAVPLICHSFQELIPHFHIVPATEKRYLLDTLTNLINLDSIKKDICLLIDVIGSDPTEQACEQAGHQYLAGLLDHPVPLLCHSFQELVHHFHIVPYINANIVPATTTVAPGNSKSVCSIST